MIYEQESIKLLDYLGLLGQRPDSYIRLMNRVLSELTKRNGYGEVPLPQNNDFGVDGNLAVPNFTYYPRAIPMPKDCIADGSVAVLIPKRVLKLSTQQILFYSTEEFFYLYRVAMNLATRTLNVDKSSSYYWGVPSLALAKNANLDFIPTPAHIFRDSPDEPLTAI
jgi:hypothetical protein